MSCEQARGGCGTLKNEDRIDLELCDRRIGKGEHRVLILQGQKAVSLTDSGRLDCRLWNCLASANQFYLAYAQRSLPVVREGPGLSCGRLALIFNICSRRREWVCNGCFCDIDGSRAQAFRVETSPEQVKEAPPCTLR